jgi:hypothetical protein
MYELRLNLDGGIAERSVPLSKAGSSDTRFEARVEALQSSGSETDATSMIAVKRATASPLPRVDRWSTSAQGSISCLESMDITLSVIPFF